MEKIKCSIQDYYYFYMQNQVCKYFLSIYLNNKIHRWMKTKYLYKNRKKIVLKQNIRNYFSNAHIFSMDFSIISCLYILIQMYDAYNIIMWRGTRHKKTRWTAHAFMMYSKYFFFSLYYINLGRVKDLRMWTCHVILF